MRQRLNKHAGVLALAALVVSLIGTGIVGAGAAGLKITSKDIQNGAVRSIDIRKSAVKSSDLSTDSVRSTDVDNGAIQSADIGDGEVEPQDVTMPPPEEGKDSSGTTINPTMQFAQIEAVAGFTKDDPSSIVEVSWQGSVEGHNGGEFSGCVFQVRVDGQPAAGSEGVFGKGLTTVGATVLFPGLAAGPHTVEIWARLAAQEPGMGGAADSCTLSPSAAGGVGQSVVVTEQVV